MIFLAAILPFLYFIFRGEIFKGLFCLILQITVIGWLPAAIWAVMSNMQYQEQRRHEELMTAMHRSSY